MVPSRTSVITKKLEQGPTESKKALYAFVGGLTVAVILVVSLASIHLHPDIAKEIVELVNTAVLFYAAVVTMLITGQAAFDWKAISALQHIDEDSNSREKIESNQPIGEVDISHGRSPKDFFRDSPF
jgi:hypothetical protein